MNLPLLSGKRICIMAATRFWAPLLLLLLVSISRLKWEKTLRYYKLESYGTVQSTSCSPGSLENASLTRDVILHRELSRVKSWNTSYHFHLNGLSRLVMLLLLVGDIKLNPGDKWKFPCGICSKPVKRNQAGIQCDQCNLWFHVNSKCCVISPEMYGILANSSSTWICPQCGLPNLSDSFFNSSVDSFNSSNYFEPLSQTAPSIPPSASYQVPTNNRSKGKPAKRRKPDF